MRKKTVGSHFYEPRSQISFFCARGLGVLERDLVWVHDTCMSVDDHEHDRLARDRGSGAKRATRGVCVCG